MKEKRARNSNSIFPITICNVIDTSKLNDRNVSLISILVIKYEIMTPPKLPSTVTIINIDAQLPARPYAIKALCNDFSSKKDNIAITPK